MKNQSMAMFRVHSTSVPTDDKLASLRASHSFRDALTAPLSLKRQTAAEIQHNIFSTMPLWVGALMTLRNNIVRVFGFNTAEAMAALEGSAIKAVGDKAGFLTVMHLSATEVICHSEDKHMHFFISVLKSKDSVTVSTMVNLKTRIGRVYMAIIKPFHWLIARVVINNAVKTGRI